MGQRTGGTTPVVRSLGGTGTAHTPASATLCRAVVCSQLSPILKPSGDNTHNCYPLPIFTIKSLVYYCFAFNKIASNFCILNTSGYNSKCH